MFMIAALLPIDNPRAILEIHIGVRPIYRNKELIMAKENKDWKDTFKKKLNIEPGVHLNEGGDKNKRRFTFSFWYFFIIILLFMALNSFMSGRQGTVYAVDYTQFKHLIQDGTIKRVAIEEEKYTGYTFS